MRYDQACRFSSAESGYRIIARSDGFNENNERNMTDAFNDTLNRMFGKMGQSAVTFTKSGNEALFAKLTLRSDIKGRRTLFTNAVVIPIREYWEMMMSDPVWVLRLPYQKLVSQQGPSEKMEKFEIPDVGSNPGYEEAAIRKAYKLDSQTAFAEYIRIVYEAITNSGSICLDTNLGPDATPELVKRYTALASLVLPKSLRKDLTFSSLGDARNFLCVNSRGSGEIISTGSSEFHFPADPEAERTFDNAEREVGIQNGFRTMMSNFANELAKRDYSERQSFLDEIEDLANQMSGSETGCASSVLLVISYYILKDNGQDFNSLSKVETVYLLSALLGYLGRKNSCNDNNINDVLINLANRLSSEQICPSLNQLSPLTIRALNQDSEKLFESVLNLLDYAADETRTDLAAIILEQDYSKKQHEFVDKLLIENPVPWDKELLSSLFAWSCQNNIESLVEKIWSRRDTNAITLIHRLISDNKKQEEGILILRMGESLFNDAEMTYMTMGLSEICYEAERSLNRQNELNEQEEQQIEDHYNELTDQFKEAWVRYIKVFKLGANNSESENFKTLNSLKQVRPEIYEDLEIALQKGTTRERKLLEDFMVDTEFSKCNTLEEIKELCDKYNIEKDPHGALEEKVVGKWYATSAIDLKKTFAETFDSYMGVNIIPLEMVNLSQESKILLSGQLIEKFWENISCRSLIQAFLFDPDIKAIINHIEKMNIKQGPETEKKIAIYKIFERAYENPEDEDIHFLFINIAEAGADEKIDIFGKEFLFTLDERQKILDGISALGECLFLKHNLFIIDFALAGTYEIDKKKPDRSDYDLESFCEWVKKVSEQLKKTQDVKVNYKQSIILYGDYADQVVRNKLRGMIKNDDPEVLLKLRDQLKNKWNPFGALRRLKER